MRSTERPDVVIVGGGVIGLSLAFELAEGGRAVTVLDHGGLAGGASHASAGMLGPISEADGGDAAVVELGRDSLDRYAAFVRRVEARSATDCGLASGGTLWVAANADEQAELDHLERTLGERDLPVERLSADRVLALEPHLSPRVSAGLRLAGERRVDPRRLLVALRVACESRGGRFISGAAVERVRRSGERHYTIEVDSGGVPERLESPQVVIAAGAWSSTRLELPLTIPTLRPVRGQLLRLQGESLLRHVVRTSEVYLVPREDGTLLVGATVEEMGFDATATAGGMMDLLRHAWRLCPAVYDLTLEGVAVGLRPATADHRPRIGLADGQGLFLAVGHYRNGVLLAPATAHYLARQILSGEPQRQLQPFAPVRRPRPRAARVTPEAKP